MPVAREKSPLIIDQPRKGQERIRDRVRAFGRVYMFSRSSLGFFSCLLSGRVENEALADQPDNTGPLPETRSDRIKRDLLRCKHWEHSKREVIRFGVRGRARESGRSMVGRR